MEGKVSIENKVLLTIEEAAAYSGVGEKKIRSLVQMPHCTFVLYNGKKILIKRERFEKYLLNSEGAL